MQSKRRNRRWSKRPTYIAYVSVYYKDGETKKCRIRNISLEGVLIKPKIDNVSVGTNLEILLPPRSPNDIEHQRTPVTVIHSSEQGTGLMFMRYDHDLFALVTKMAYGNINQSGH